eukprot:14494050-Alexandrium_andersonii.AAC.1
MPPPTSACQHSEGSPEASTPSPASSREQLQGFGDAFRDDRRTSGALALMSSCICAVVPFTSPRSPSPAMAWPAHPRHLPRRLSVRRVPDNDVFGRRGAPSPGDSLHLRRRPVRIASEPVAGDGVAGDVCGTIGHYEACAGLVLPGPRHVPDDMPDRQSSPALVSFYVNAFCLNIAAEPIAGSGIARDFHGTIGDIGDAAGLGRPGALRIQRSCGRSRAREPPRQRHRPLRHRFAAHGWRWHRRRGAPPEDSPESSS